MYEIFEKLCAQKGVTPYRVGKETGISTPTFSNWKKGKYTPKDDKMKLIAEYFGVSVEYLRYGKEAEKESISGNEYYFDDESAKYAEFLFNNPDYKVLFEASRNVKPEDIDFVRQMIERTSRNDK